MYSSLKKSILPLRSGSTWIALGDSITENGRSQLWIEFYLRTRCGLSNFRTINAGIGGDTAAGAKRRLGWDVLRYGPTFATVLFGMNDVARDLYIPWPDSVNLELRGKYLAEFETNLRVIVGLLKAGGVQVTLLSPTPFEHSLALTQVDAPGVDDALIRCSELVRMIAKEEKVAYIDLHAAMSMMNQVYKHEYQVATLISEDRIHPGELGHFAMASIILNEAGLIQSAPIPDVEAKKWPERWTASGKGYFTVKFDRLPFLVDLPEAPRSWLDQVMNQIGGGDRLRIGSLPEGKYQLLVDEKICGQFESQQFASGVPLEDLSNFTPVQESLKLMSRLKEKAGEWGKLRVIAWSEHFGFSEGRPCSIRVDEVEKRLQTLKRSGAQSSAETIDRRLSVYRQFKERESEIRNRITEIENEMETIVSPREILFSLRRV